MCVAAALRLNPNGCALTLGSKRILRRIFAGAPRRVVHAATDHPAAGVLALLLHGADASATDTHGNCALHFCMVSYDSYFPTAMLVATAAVPRRTAAAVVRVTCRIARCPTRPMTGAA
jgi:hypothetical protein